MSIRLSEVWIYPIKSLGGIRVKKGKVLDKGLEHDRRYMLVDLDNRFLTQRVHPQMSQFRLSRHEQNFKVSFKEDYVEIPVQPTQLGKSVEVSIWDDTVSAFLMEDTVNNWFSARLGMPCKLVFFPEENERAVDREFAKNNEQVSLADGYPFLVIGKSSLEDLNLRLKNPVPMNRFRPNLVFEGGKPYEEDLWKKVNIGASQFEGLKLCARCVLTTVDQETGEKGAEPLATLSTYRKKGSKVNFGQNLVRIKGDEVIEGDEIHVLSLQE
ncbi:MAG: MOSC domain-containing protein [Cyclobacteriaceae bacterium]